MENIPFSFTGRISRYWITFPGGRVDIAVIIAGSNDEDLWAKAERERVVLEPVATSPLLAWVHKDNPLADKDALTWRDLHEASLTFAAHKSFDDIRYASRYILLDAGVFPNCTLTVRAAANAEEFYMGIADVDVCLLSPEMSRDPVIMACDDRKTITINEKLATLTYYVAFSADPKNPDIYRVLDLIEEDLAEQGSALSHADR